MARRYLVKTVMTISMYAKLMAKTESNDRSGGNGNDENGGEAKICDERK
jgi:hypothetical protein